MKNIKFIFAALVSLAALSCVELESPDTTPETNQDSGLMTLVLSTGKQTKTHISDVTTNGVTEIHWDEGDAITVFSSGTTLNNNKYSFAMSGKPNGNFAQFTGEISRGSDYIWAVYPQSNASTGSTDGSQIVVSLASSQASVANSFASNLNISVAKSKITTNNDWAGIGDYELNETVLVNFKNVCSLLKFTAPADASQIESVVITVDKPIVGDLTINYSGENPQVTGVSGGKSITMNGPFAANTDYYFVLAPVAISDLSVYVNTSDKKQYSATKTFGNDSQLQLKPGQYKSLGTLNFNNMPSFSVDFDIQDDGGFLSGTDVIFTFPSNNITDVQLTISQNDGNASRTINVSDPAIDSEGRFVSSCSNDTSWPYLPKGTYTIEGSYKTPAGLVSVSGAELIIDESPNFSVGGLDAYTSYTKYTSGTNTAVADANACDGASIYVTASNVGISENILKNTNYKNLLQVQFVAPASGYGVANLTNGLTATLSNQQYGEYKSPSYVFDGKAVSFPNVVCHVTGLPYVLSKTGNGVNVWEGEGTGDAFTWSSNSMTMGPLAGAMNIIHAYHIPGDILVYVSTAGSVTNGGITKKTGKITVGTKQVVSTEVSGWKQGKLDSNNVEAKFTTSAYKAQVNFSNAAASNLTVTAFTINYR